MSKRIWPPQDPLLRFMLGGPIPDDWEDPRARREGMPPPVNDLDSVAAGTMGPRRRRRFSQRTNRKLWGEPQRSVVDALDFMEAKLLPAPECDDA